MTTNEPIGRAGIPRTTYAWRTGGASETGHATHRESDTRRFAMSEVDEAGSAADGRRLAEGCSFGYIRGLVQATR